MERLERLKSWLKDDVGLGSFDISPASDDASFRRYFRVLHDGKSLIAMDAPPDKEDCHPFVEIAESFAKLGLHVPEVIEKNFEQGFLLLSDLGSTLYLQVLNDENVDRLYGDAMGALIALQACGAVRATLPPYDLTLLLTEMQLFPDWFLGKHLAMNLTDQEQQILSDVFSFLSESALEQPVVCVHRDYHSRNLMVLESNNPGILDFQDAVAGPVTYDLVSLLRDCYIAWPRQRVDDWVLAYRELAMQSGILRDENERQFLRWFDLMGMQRHLKAIGIFARLNYRDQKPGYLQDIPRTMSYVKDVSSRYPELSEFHVLLNNKVLPAFNP